MERGERDGEMGYFRVNGFSDKGFRVNGFDQGRGNLVLKLFRFFLICLKSSDYC